MADDAGLAARGVQQAGRHAQQRGLAAAVVTDERDVLPLRHLQVQWQQRLLVALVLAQLVGTERGSHALLLLCWRCAVVWAWPSSMNARILRRTSSRTFTQ